MPRPARPAGDGGGRAWRRHHPVRAAHSPLSRARTARDLRRQAAQRAAGRALRQAPAPARLCEGVLRDARRTRPQRLSFALWNRANAYLTVKVWVASPVLSAASTATTRITLVPDGSLTPWSDIEPASLLAR